MKQFKLSYLLSIIEALLPYLKVNNASTSTGITNRTSAGQRAVPLVRLPASNIFQRRLTELELRVQRELVCAQPNQKLLQGLHKYIAQQLHHIETIKIPSVLKESKQWDPQRSIAIVFGDFARRLGSFPSSTR